jgi:hypothetical protein
LFNEADDPDHAGWIQFTLSAARLSFSGRLQMGTEKFPFTGQFTEAHYAESTVPRKNRSALSLRLQLVTTNQNSIVLGSVSAPTWTTPLFGHILYFNSKAPTPHAGRYTVSFLNTNTAPHLPNGHGGASIIISPSGKVAVSARTATGTAISQAAGLGKNGDFPLYLTGLKGRERAVGWVRVANTGVSVASANVWWTKLPGPDPSYAQGFSLELTAEGSRWAPAASGNLLGFSQGKATFAGGDLANPGTAPGAVVPVASPDGKVFQSVGEAAQVKLSFSKSTGNMTGEFRHPVTGQRLKVWGYGLPQQRTATGFFLGNTYSGSISLTPLP